MSRSQNRRSNPAGARRTAAALIILALAWGLVLPQAALAAYWKLSGDLNVARAFHTVTKLQDGRVLVVGGRGVDNTILDSAEVYDPATGQWTLVPPMSKSRVDHTATLMNDGRVLVVGGRGTSIQKAGEYSDPITDIWKAGEYYDPFTNTWQIIPDMMNPRAAQVALKLANNQVVAAGGTDGSQDLNSAEFYDPNDIQPHWTTTGNMANARSGAASLQLGDQNLVVGGTNGAQTLNSVEGYDSITKAWHNFASLNYARCNPLAFPLPDGGALVFSGYGPQGYTNTAERYNPTGRLWYDITPYPGTIREDAAAAQLPTGTVVFGGGFNDARLPLNSTLVYDWQNDLWNSGPNLNNASGGHTFTTLNNGNVLAAGGQGNQGAYLKKTEVMVQNVDTSAANVLLLYHSETP